MPLDQQDRHFKQLACDWTNATNRELLELIWIIVFHVSKYSTIIIAYNKAIVSTTQFVDARVA
jgi:hypothetical protein